MEESTDLQYIGMKTGHANIEQMDSMRDTTETEKMIRQRLETS